MPIESEWVKLDITWLKDDSLESSRKRASKYERPCQCQRDASMTMGEMAMRAKCLSPLPGASRMLSAFNPPMNRWASVAMSLAGLRRKRMATASRSRSWPKPSEANSPPPNTSSPSNSTAEQQHRDYEPASTLLERIHTKAATVKIASTKRRRMRPSSPRNSRS